MKQNFGMCWVEHSRSVRVLFSSRNRRPETVIVQEGPWNSILSNWVKFLNMSNALKMREKQKQAEKKGSGVLSTFFLKTKIKNFKKRIKE